MNVEVYVNFTTGTIESNLCAVKKGFGYRKQRKAQIWTYRHIHNLLTLSVVAWRVETGACDSHKQLGDQVLENEIS